MKLTHPATRHEVTTDDKSADFWRAAGYVDSAPKKAPAKKAASAKKTSK